MESIKTVVVGDGTVGKTCLLSSYSTNRFPDDYIPTVFDNYSVNVMVDGCVVCMSLWDTAGQEEYARLRPLSYPGTDMFLLLFDITSEDSFANIKSQWLPEVRKHCPEASVILVGTKGDLRGDYKVMQKLAYKGKSMVTKEAAVTFAKESGLVGYREVSALTQDGVHPLFDAVVSTTLKSRTEKIKKKTRKVCSII